jgi:hypothetical protein
MRGSRPNPPAPEPRPRNPEALLRLIVRQHRELLEYVESTLPPIDASVFIPSPLQEAILAALNGKGLRAEALALRCDVNKSQLYNVKGAIPELQEEGLIAHHPRVGYYRLDAPPPNVAQLMS